MKNKEFLKEIKELINLEEGWYDGEGRTYSKEEVDWVYKNFERFYFEGFYVCPDPVGGIYMEWQFEKENNDINFSLDFDYSRKIIEEFVGFKYNTKTNKIENYIVDKKDMELTKENIDFVFRTLEEHYNGK